MKTTSYTTQAARTTSVTTTAHTTREDFKHDTEDTLTRDDDDYIVYNPGGTRTNGTSNGAT